MTEEDAVLVAAHRWWMSKRPIPWSEEAHIANPAVNCASPQERELAESIARIRQSVLAQERES
ncbi:MAG: hypothetical protein FWC87_00195 [Acidimicrobiaceae bacterium]|nr:hypothetical protein [Acidimicrobiaceae bacterium]